MTKKAVKTTKAAAIIDYETQLLEIQEHVVKALATIGAYNQEGGVVAYENSFAVEWLPFYVENELNAALKLIARATGQANKKESL